VNIDTLARETVPAGTVFTPNAWAAAKARYDIDLGAPVSTLLLDRS
jgi:hypothetical protein